MEAQLGSQAVNLQTQIQGRKLGDGLQQRGEAEPVEEGTVSAEEAIVKEGAFRCGATRKLTEELVGETGVWVWNVGEKRECIVKS